MDCGDPPLFSPNDTTMQQILGFIYDFRMYLALFLCVFGLLANAVHIWVLRQPRLRSTSVHTVLIGIACSDIGTMVSYLVYITRFEFFEDPQGYSYIWAVFLTTHVIVSIACHAITLYLVVLMAFIRWRVMISPGSGWMRTQRAKLGSILVAAWVIVLCVPTLLAHQIKKRDTILLSDDGSTRDTYSIDFSNLMMRNGCLLMRANLWLTGVFLKAIPGFLLFWLTLGLIHQMRVNREKRKLVLHVKEDEKMRRRGDQTTYMLLLMVTVFLITELPQGIVAILNAKYTGEFYLFVYMRLADLLDVLSLVNCYVAFLVYICTCSRYRQTLLSILPNVERVVSTLTTRQNTIITNYAPTQSQKHAQNGRVEATVLLNGADNYDTFL